jgi:molecular chaperone DnaK
MTAAYFGIDFGTTNCTAVRIIGGEFQKYGDETGFPLPSTVALDIATGEAFCGRSVWNNREQDRQAGNYHVIESVKWHLGTDERWPTEARIWTPEEVAAQLFRQLSGRAQQRGIDPIAKAVIAIPVDYPATLRRSLRRAAQMAEIEVITFITESTAALIRHFGKLQHCRYVAIFDWGGGTLDISILEIRDGRIVELATEGMPIAGNAIDDDFAQAVHAKVMEQRRLSTPFSAMSSIDRDNLRTKCEFAKRCLSNQDATRILLTSYGGEPVNIEVARPWFESLISAHVELAIEELAKAVVSSGLSYDAINRLLVIGGSSQLSLLREKLRSDRRFSAAFLEPSEAEWDVAAGAAIVAQHPGAYQMAESIGILLSDGAFHDLVREGETVVPTERCVSLSLVEDVRQANLIIEKRANGFRKRIPPERILEFGVETAGFDLERIDLTYKIDPDFILQLKARSRAIHCQDVAHEYGKLRLSYEIAQ